MEKRTYAVMGSGSAGHALAAILSKTGHAVRMYDIDEEKIRALDTKNNRLVKMVTITDLGINTVKKINNAIIARFSGISACISPDEVESIKESLATFRKTVEQFIQNKI